MSAHVRVPAAALLTRGCALALISGLIVAGCGSSAGKIAGRSGGTVTVLEVNGGVDSLDPGFWYYQTDYTDLAQTTQRWLYGWRARSLTPVPDLATAMPALSDGGRTLTIHIRSGIHYSPPLAARTVSSADIKYAIERCFLASVGNGYAFDYYGEIEGAPHEPVSHLVNIPGIRTPNATTLVIHTSVPVGVLDDADALALPCTAPVPQSYAERFDRGAQSTYGEHQLFTGPYMIAGAGSGTVPHSSYVPGRLLVLERNPSWRRESDPIRSAYFNGIIFRGGYSRTVASREVLEGTSLMSGDFTAPPPAILAEALSSRRSQLYITPAQATRYISLNTRVKPLDNVDVRRAIGAVIDRSALLRLIGGPTLGAIATHFLAPEMPGFNVAGGYRGPGYDFISHPEGDLALAQHYMRLAGYPSGRYEGPPLSAVAADEAPQKNVAEAIQSQLAQIGINLELHEVPHTTMLTKYCTVPKAHIAICPNLSWGKDFFDSQSMIAPIFDGNLIQEQANTDTSLADNPAYNAQIEAAKQVIGERARAQAWGRLDRELTAEAYVIPWLWENQVSFASANVKGVPWAFNSGAWDLTASSLK